MSDNNNFDSDEDNYFLYDISRQNSFPDFYNPENFNPLPTETNNNPEYVLVPEPQMEENEKENVAEEKENTLTADKTITKTSVENKKEGENKKEDNTNSENNRGKNGVGLLGRKRKSDRNERNDGNDLGDKKEKEHTKYDEDNMMRKIKSNYAHFMVNYVNESLSPDHLKFLKVHKDLNKDITIKMNQELNNMKLRDIFKRYKISKKYSKKKYEENYNAKLVETIYRENTETEAIKKLDKTYIQVLDIMRTDYLPQFKKDITKKEINNGEDEKTAEKHVDQLVDLLLRYENWFSEKNGRPLRNERNCFNK